MLQKYDYEFTAKGTKFTGTKYELSNYRFSVNEKICRFTEFLERRKFYKIEAVIRNTFFLH